MTGDGIHARLLPDGRRLHLQHGPIDLIIEAFGEPTEVWAAYEQATAGFADVLPMLVRELPLLRTPLCATPPSLTLPHKGGGDQNRDALLSSPSPLMGEGWGGGDSSIPGAKGPVARRMIAACWPHRAGFITPMAAVAGAVADHMLEIMLEGRHLDRAFVNDGGDIAFYLAPGQQLTCGLVADLRAPAIEGTIALTHAMPARGIATSGRATKGQGGRSFSLGIADAVTVLARDAAAADAAATVVANAVDLPGHAAIVRGPASAIDPDSDLGERLVTLDVGPLSGAEISTALHSGMTRAEALRRSGLIHGAVLVLRRRFVTVGAGLPQLEAA